VPGIPPKQGAEQPDVPPGERALGAGATVSLDLPVFAAISSRFRDKRVTMEQVFVFPGQGSQVVGMGKDLAGAFTVARDVFE
jgi:hypothetical protein